MGGSRWRSASVFLTLIFVLVVGAVSRMEAQGDKSRLGACVALPPIDNAAIAGNQHPARRFETAASTKQGQSRVPLQRRGQRVRAAGARVG